MRSPPIPSSLRPQQGSDPATCRARTRPRPRIRLEASLGTLEGRWFSPPVPQSSSNRAIVRPDIINKALQGLIRRTTPDQPNQPSQPIDAYFGGFPFPLRSLLPIPNSVQSPFCERLAHKASAPSRRSTASTANRSTASQLHTIHTYELQEPHGLHQWARLTLPREAGNPSAWSTLICPQKAPPIVPQTRPPL